jgi:hypothetical protein
MRTEHVKTKESTFCGDQPGDGSPKALRQSVLRTGRDGEPDQGTTFAFVCRPDQLPRQVGQPVSAAARAQPAFKKLPIIMLTGSEELADINRAYELGVTSCLVKSAYSPEFRQNVRIILKFWLELNRTAS